MAVLIKKYHVRYDGKKYGPGQPEGQVLEGLSEKEEARLINGSNGTIEKYVPLELKQNGGENQGGSNEEQGQSEENGGGAGENNEGSGGSTGDGEPPDQTRNENQDSGGEGVSDGEGDEDILGDLNPDDFIKPGNPSKKADKKK